MIDEPAEREHFEAWWGKNLDQEVEGNYKNESTAKAWEAWKIVANGIRTLMSRKI